jgi:hypothetical protein
MYYISNVLYHIHPIYSLGYLNNWIGQVRAESVCWLRAPGGQSARTGGQSARRSRGQLAEQAIFLSLMHLLVAPLPHVCGCESKRPSSLFVAAHPLPILSQTHNTTSTPLTHSLFLPTDTTSIVRGTKASTPPRQGKLLFVQQGPPPLDFHPLEPLLSNLGQEQGICKLPSIFLLDAYLVECF